MNTIQCQLFGIPQITKDGKKVFFPYAKINALVYYILINKIISRDEIANLLWPEENEKIAKKNLRNALYQAKKTLDCEFIKSPQKSILVLNDEIDIKIDVDEFIKSPQENLNLYTGDFLNGFFLKDAESFEFWITKMRNHYQDEFISNCYTKIESDIQNNISENVEKNIQRLTEIDEFNEDNFRLLMNFYQKNNKHEKVIETYYDLSKLFNDELGVNPENKTKRIYEASLEYLSQKNSRSNIKDKFFYGRYDEIAQIEQIFHSLKNGNTSKSILIKGEAGIGKSALKRKVLSNKYDDFFIVESFCYQAEENYALRPIGIIIDKIGGILKENNISVPTFWNTTISKLFPNIDDEIPNVKLLETKEFLKFDLLTTALVDAIKEISKTKKLIIVLEDIQWMDQTSLELLTSVMLHLNHNEGIFLATSRNQYNTDVENLISSLNRYDKVLCIELNRFNYVESEQFIRKALPDKSIDNDSMEKIYTETTGNSFFLSEYVNLIKNGKTTDLMTSKMIDALKSRFLYLSEDEKTLLDIVSFFYDEAPLDIICEITKFSEIDVINLLEKLENRNILTEKLHKNHISLLFTHTKLREYIYMNQSNSKKKIFHKSIGDILERNLDNKKSNPYIYSKLVYHFSSAGDECKALKYKIETLNYYLNFSHELFPILPTTEIEKDEKIYISRDKIQDMFQSLETTFKDLKKKETSSDLNLLEIEFFYMKGRYLIRDGNYEDGTSAIKYIISKSNEIDNKDFILEGYKQMIFYNIQTNNSHDMNEYIELALDLAVKCNYHKEIGIILRLKGLYNIMIGNYFLAEKLLKESINIFNVTEEVANRYSINIAAAYNYIGEIRFASAQYTEATKEFLKAIELTKNKNALSSLSVFYINAGKSSYVQGNIKDAQEHFKNAYTLYGQFDSFWKRPVLDSYMTLTEIALKNYESSLKHLDNALIFADKMQNPRDIGAVYFAQYIIIENMEKCDELKSIYKDKFKHDKDYYKERAISYLDEYRDVYEINILKA